MPQSVNHPNQTDACAKEENDPNLEELIVLRVESKPMAQPRTRSTSFFSKSGKLGSRVYTPGTANGWKYIVAMTARSIAKRLPKPLSGPIRIDIKFLFYRPKSMRRKRDPDGRIPHIIKPDRDNLDKAVLDSLTDVGMLSDDKIVYTGTISKYIVAKENDLPGAIVNIRYSRQD